MQTFAVRFKGLLFKLHLDRLDKAGIELHSSKPGLRINTVIVEADSEEAAVAKVMEKLAPDDVNFTQWESGPTS